MENKIKQTKKRKQFSLQEERNEIPHQPLFVINV